DTSLNPQPKPQSKREINDLIHPKARNRQNKADSIASKKPPPGQNKSHNKPTQTDSTPIHSALPP
ncbi:hypothetical protein, partial [Aminobacter aminovorans]|uniref:hypothetical protein n=1 Tax=Aminobacter aminovorans TaxID=83263 RepID=UPI0031E68247